MNILKSWQRLNPETPELVPIGFINQTYRIKITGGFGILQKLHPVFAPEVNKDILAVTEFLASHGFATPQLIKTDSGDLWALEQSQCWRMMTFMEGHTFEQLKNADLAFS